MEPIVLVHGGAGLISNEKRALKLLKGARIAAHEAFGILKEGGSVVDAVEHAVRLMEDDPAFNAGLGSVLNLDGEVEMDASIMVGHDLNAGAVSSVKDIQNPISLARLVMEKTDHVLLTGDGAIKFAKDQGVTLLPEGSLVTEKAKVNYKKLLEKLAISAPAGDELGTVGAVAFDGKGHLAAATSTGGREGKLPGRCSDTSIIGSGTYADDTIGAVSTTGHGETITKYCLAHSILNEIAKGQTAQEATTYCIKNMTERLNNTAGAITLSANGDVGIDFSTKRMTWAYRKGNEIHYGIDHDQHEVFIDKPKK